MDKIDNIGLTRMLTQAYDFEGFTSNPIFTFNNGMLNITFEKARESNGWLFATLL